MTTPTRVRAAVRDGPAPSAGDAPIEALLFDLGGVIVAIDWQRVFEAWAADAGVPPARVASRFAFGAAYHAHERGELADDEFFAHVARELDVGLDAAQVARGWDRIFVGAMPGMRELLATLAERWPLYLFSNTNRAHHRRWAADYAAELAPLQRQFLSHEMGLRKPAAEAFHAVAHSIGVPPARLLFVDDTLENVHGARAAGLPAEQVRDTPSVRAALARHGIVVAD